MTSIRREPESSMRAYSPFTLGVLATISVFVQFFVQILLFKSLGILLLAMKEEFDTNTWVLGSVIEVTECVGDLLAPIAGPLGKKFGHRPVVMTGGILVTVGFVAASRASSVLRIALPLNLLTGMGYSFVRVLTRATHGKHFDSRQFALASGIAKTGSSVSLLIMPPLVQLFLDTYGWRGAMLLVGSIVAHLIVCGALLIPSPEGTDDHFRREYQPLATNQFPSDQVSRLDANSRGIRGSLKSLLCEVRDGFDLALMKDCDFWVITLVIVTTRITKSAWTLYFVPHAVAKGFTNNSAALMVTLAGLGHLICTLLVSAFVFKRILTTTTAMIVSICLLAASFFVDPWMNYGWLMAADGVLYVGAMGVVFAMSDVMIKEVLGADRMASAYGWMGFFSGTFRLSAGFIPGWIYDHCGSYDLAFVILGVIEAVSLIPLLLRRLRQSFTNPST